VSRTTKKLDASTWWTLAKCAAAFGMTRQGFHMSIRPMLGPDEIRGNGRDLRIDVSAAVRRFIDRQVSKQVSKAVEAVTPAADPMLVGAASPALEEYRLHRARLAAMDVEDREKTHADIGQLNAAVTGFAGRILNTAGVLRSRFGPDAAEIVENAVAAARDGWGRR
jgi:hypothetical protein